MDLFTLEKTLVDLQKNPAVFTSADGFLLVNNILSTLQSIQGIANNLNSDHINDNYKVQMINKINELEDFFSALVLQRLESVGLGELFRQNLNNNVYSQPYNMLNNQFIKDGMQNTVYNTNFATKPNNFNFSNQNVHSNTMTAKSNFGFETVSTEKVEYPRAKEEINPLSSGLEKSNDKLASQDFNKTSNDSGATAGRDYLLSILEGKNK